METAMKTPLPKTYCNGDTPKRYVVIKECPLSCAEGPMSSFMIPKGNYVDAVGEVGGWVEIRAFVPKKCLEPHQKARKKKKKKKKKKEEAAAEKEPKEKKDETSSSLETTSDTAPPPVEIKRIRSETEIPGSNGGGGDSGGGECAGGDGNKEEEEEEEEETGVEETLSGTTVL